MDFSKNVNGGMRDMEILRDMYLSYFNDNFSYDEYLDLIEGEDEITEDYILEIIMQDFIKELNAHIFIEFPS